MKKGASGENRVKDGDYTLEPRFKGKTYFSFLHQSLQTLSMIFKREQKIFGRTKGNTLHYSQ